MEKRACVRGHFGKWSKETQAGDRRSAVGRRETRSPVCTAGTRSLGGTHWAASGIGPEPESQKRGGSIGSISHLLRGSQVGCHQHSLACPRVTLNDLLRHSLCTEKKSKEETEATWCSSQDTWEWLGGINLNETGSSRWASLPFNTRKGYQGQGPSCSHLFFSFLFF